MPEQIDFAELYNLYEKNTLQYPKILTILSEDLNISTISLRNLGVGFNPANQSWIFPERNSKGEVTGLLQRFSDGKKFMVKGSRRGLIYAINRADIKDKYASGKENWIRVSQTKPCPLCGKADGCLLPAKVYLRVRRSPLTWAIFISLTRKGINRQIAHYYIRQIHYQFLWLRVQQMFLRLWTWASRR